MKDYSFHWEGTNGKGVLLVHGLTGAPAEMMFVGRQLHERGFTVYAPTLPGHCQDKISLVRTRFEDWLDGLRESLHDFRKTVEEVYAAGSNFDAFVKNLHLVFAAELQVLLRHFDG